ncbi:prolyl 4-hydroxylase [Coniochaeta ligniaria NRRL 30616]|uniref:Prolyl 4-hydroxylase n=1 Tax=Coniochaeta ligniaria NRRL 30616 TaxID=1408157 RepID=A0A1J7I7W8_9PEZI|nr:prolyl 4-hydroxylase [Coniochaeta ligniaria NRRL 30616]
MSKSKAQKRKQVAQVDLPNKKLAKTTGIITPPPDSDNAQPKSLQTVVSDEELEIAVETLAALAQHPSLIKSKACKDLRAAVYDFRQASSTGLANAADTNLTGQVTGALTDGKYTEARIKLAEMRIRGQEPKLGALCRWVRDLDVISGISTVPEAQGGASVVQRTAHEKELITVIDAVLRTAGHSDTNPSAISYPDCPIALQPTWDLRPSTPSEQVYASVLDKSIFASAPNNLSSSLRIIETTPGPQRKPPNHHDAILYTSAPNTIPLSAAANHPAVQYHPHPTVPGLGLATNVLSPQECRAIVAAGETATFVPDAPLREDGDVSILAHNFYWVVDEPFHDALWRRIAPFVPAAVGGRVARGLNRRFRVYRYVPGAEYRAHIDGAWPPSGILADDTYVYDASPPGKKQSSLFTFLIYLNDEFEGGETTFFLPAAREGTLNAYPVRPVMGAVAVFPHGDPRLAVLHEGTGVRSGAKYVVRTEVEYDVEPTVEG